MLFQLRRFNVAIINLTMMNEASSKMLSIQQSAQEGSQAGYAHRLINIYTHNSLFTSHHVDQETGVSKLDTLSSGDTYQNLDLKRLLTYSFIGKGI